MEKEKIMRQSTSVWKMTKMGNNSSAWRPNEDRCDGYEEKINWKGRQVGNYCSLSNIIPK